ncbi:ABC transporter permease [Anaeromicropila populeti]|uniref:ABC-2 type transport system permease protein n=1 Tax=Anaeromicropila populeti TaxID=37658 RepID=A0A1I6HUH6_9FIRM|nr:ABC transporter permease [Anaeromicropila populeti]SFR58093.1 ABC-2 type transport system permease protein [Anaeromicropila populeti]
MRKFLTVLQFELVTYFKNKTYIITTVGVALLVAVLMFLPNFVDISSLLGTDDTKIESIIDTPDTDSATDIQDSRVMAIYDEASVITDESLLAALFPATSWHNASSVDEVKELVNKSEAEAGFVIHSATSFDFYVLNKSLFNNSSSQFQTILSTLLKQKYCEEHGLNVEELDSVYYAPIEVKEQVLGKDSAQNYWYCYALVILVFMIVILYGNMIAISVTSEKSNRSIEVLVTSTNPAYLLFGKVIAGCIASLLQCGIILGTTLAGYQFNAEKWNYQLDMFLNIPGSVLMTFSLFGLGGFLFFAFIYGAVGALVSKTEDVSKSSGGIQMIIMIVYFAVLFQLQNVDGIVIKVASFLPISSYSAMFVRVAMGKVAAWEVAASLILLYGSILGIGILGAKIYRMGTLRYGNPIKFTQVFKFLKQQ